MKAKRRREGARPPRTAAPLYRDLSAFLRNEVTRGNFALGEKIPTEPELCLLRGVSRTTVRLAVQELVDEGVLDRQQGRGTFVARLPKPPDERGLLNVAPTQDYRFRFVESGWIAAPFELATAFGLPADGEVFTLTRVQLDAGRPVAVKRYFAPADLLRDAPPSKEELDRVPFDAWLLARKVRMQRTNLQAEPIFLGAEDAALLDATPGGLSLFTQRVAFDETGRAVRLSQTVLRSEKARLFWSVRHPYGTGNGANFSVWTAGAFD